LKKSTFRCAIRPLKHLLIWTETIFTLANQPFTITVEAVAKTTKLQLIF
jgi:hypothetical protein